MVKASSKKAAGTASGSLAVLKVDNSLTSANSKEEDKKWLNCPKGHPVLKNKVLRVWQGRVHTRVCDRCGTDVTRTEVRWRCQHKCDYDLCNKCYEVAGGAFDDEEEEGKARLSLPDGTPVSGVSGGRVKCNGFNFVLEPESIACDSENICQFSLPQEALNFEPHPDAVYMLDPAGKSGVERFIHCNSELLEKELGILKELQRFTIRGKKEFYPSVALMATRQMGTARGDIAKAMDLMVKTQDWRANFFKDGPITDKKAEEHLKHGFMYFTGRDPQLRPVLVLRGNRVPAEWIKNSRSDLLIEALIFVMEYMIRYMFIPGRIENVVLIVDLNGLSTSQVPLSTLKDVYKVMSNSYAGRLKTIYICNMPMGIRMLMGAAKAILTDRQQRKLVVISDLSEMQKHICVRHLEQDLGGGREPVTKFFPFPLLAGPFDLDSKEARPGAVPNCHMVLERAGVGGQLWDIRRSKEENHAVEYSDLAPAIFEKCGLPPPKVYNLSDDVEEDADFEQEDEMFMSSDPATMGYSEMMCSIFNLHKCCNSSSHS